MTWDPLAPRTWRLARLVRVTLARLLPVLFRTRVLHAERVAFAGGAVLAGNHVSYADPMLLWCVSPRPVRFMAKSGLWAQPILAWGLNHFWAFPVRRGEADRQAIATATALLQRGELVGIFPEGTRVRDGEGEARGGVAFLAVRAGVPVIPVGIGGTDRIRPPGSRLPRFPRVTIVFGEPVRPEDFAHLPGRKERVEAMTAEVMTRIGSALEEARSVT